MGEQRCLLQIKNVYYVLSRSISVTGKGETHVLDRGDVIYIAPWEGRKITVNGNECASTLVINVEP